MSPPAIPDLRHLANGHEIPTESYSDQPYIVTTDDGAWLCTVTTGAGHEGDPGQHVISRRSTDLGQTWSAPVDVEPINGPEASYAVMLKAPSGRIYVFYNHNSDNVRELEYEENGQVKRFTRVDSLGHFVFKYSDDHGRSWSAQRYDIPVRRFRCDRENFHHGKLCYFWNVGKPFVQAGRAYVSLHKVGRMGKGFFSQSEGVLLASANLLTEAAPEKITWETLPEGEVGLRTPPGGGPIAEEQSYCVLSDGSFYCVYRSIDGFPVEAYSRDGGRTWSEPRYKCYADGRRMKHPRAANFAWRCANGKYLYWFHNHGGRFIGENPNALNMAYEDRNPVWFSAGIEADAPEGKVILWSQPEIGLYDDDPWIRISYPDLVEAAGRYFLTETQKDVARVHEIPAALLTGMWQTLEATVSGRIADSAMLPAETSLILALPATAGPLPAEAPLPELPLFSCRDGACLDMRGKDLRAGFTLELQVLLNSFAPGQLLLDSRTPWGQGLCLATSSRNNLQLILDDGRTDCRWECDPVLQAGCWHHLVVTVDGGPKIISFIVDGKFCDGGDWRQFGWGRFNPHLRHANGEKKLRIGPRLDGEIRSLRIYNRSLRTFEAVALAGQCRVP